MTTTEQYTIHEVVQMIKEDKLRLPTFQRNYVWEKTDIVKLFSTLFSDNTFGAISAIKTTIGYPIFSTRSFVDDLQDKCKLSVSNYTPNYSTDDPLYLILDGQQRLQSFYLAFDGDFDKEELFLNTEDCTVAFYKTSPNDKCIPIKKLYNKMSRVSYEQTAKFFGKDKNENIFKFFYHIFFTKRITFLISEPCNELEKDKDRFTNLFIKVNTAGINLSEPEAFICRIKGIDPSLTPFFDKLRNIDSDNILWSMKRLLFASTTTKYVDYPYESEALLCFIILSQQEIIDSTEEYIYSYYCILKNGAGYCTSEWLFKTINKLEYQKVKSLIEYLKRYEEKILNDYKLCCQYLDLKLITIIQNKSCISSIDDTLIYIVSKMSKYTQMDDFSKCVLILAYITTTDIVLDFETTNGKRYQFVFLFTPLIIGAKENTEIKIKKISNCYSPKSQIIDDSFYEKWIKKLKENYISRLNPGNCLDELTSFLAHRKIWYK